MRRYLFALLLFFDLIPSAQALKPSALPQSFIRAAPLPNWTETLMTVPATRRTDPVVIRLAETQQWVGSQPETSAVLLNRAFQVNDKSALGLVGQFGIDYFPSYQKLLLHRVAILREGKVLDRTATVNIRPLEREQGLEAGTMGGAVTLQLLLDDVRVGDTLWITYTIVGENPVFGQRWSGEFRVDSEVPVEVRRLTVLHSGSQTLHWRQLGDFRTEKITPVIDQVGSLERLRFEVRQLEPIEGEPSAPPDYLGGRRLQFSEFDDWHAVAGWAVGLFPHAPVSAATSVLVRQFSAAPTPAARASAALVWVQEQIRYFSVSIGENSHRPQVPDVVLKRRYGDCKDKSYLLVSLLQQLGIEAQPMLLSAQAPRLPAKLLATPLWFDHVIVRLRLDGRDYYVDPTRSGQHAPLDQLPNAFPGALALAVDVASTALTTLPEDGEQYPMLDVVEQIALATFDGDATLEAQFIYRGNYADWARQRYPLLSSSELKKDALERYEKQYPGVTLVGVPQIDDRLADNSFVLTARYTLPKPITHKDGQYRIDYDSRIVDGTLGIPAKLVRNFPFELAGGKFRGRYRFHLQWPVTVRLVNEAAAEAIDNPWFMLHSEILARGNDLNYVLDYHIKLDRVEAAELPALQLQAKRMLPVMSGSFQVSDETIVLPKVQAFSYRNLEMMIAAEMIVAKVPTFKGVKDADISVDSACEMLYLMRLYADGLGPQSGTVASQTEQLLATKKAAPGLAQCLARQAFATGDFTTSSRLYQIIAELPADSPLLPKRAWARFYAGDADGAAADIMRYRQARLASGSDTAFDALDALALLQRSGRPVPDAWLTYARAQPDGPWPRPLLALLAGSASEPAVLAAAAALTPVAREVGLNDAWFYIGSARLTRHDTVGALKAWRWYNAYGIRSTRQYQQARGEVQRLQQADPDYRAGNAAADKGDRAGAVAMWRLAAQRGSSAAQQALGIAYYYGDGGRDGHGIAVDMAQAVGWFRAAAGQQEPAAQNMLGVMYGTGHGVAVDDAAAVAWYRLAADGWDGNAAFNLADRYAAGRTVPQDAALAVQYMRLAAESGHLEAQARLGTMYVDGAGVARDLTQALFWRARAAAAGNADAQASLGDMYMMGEGVTQDFAKAITYYRLSAAQGDDDAELSLGFAYETGRGVGVDEILAGAWYEKAAAKGNPKAMARRGMLYLFAKTSPKQYEKARPWLEQAAAQGSPMGQYFLASLEQFGHGGPVDMASAIINYQKAAEQGFTWAQEALGKIYHFGHGVPRDTVQAARWYRLAIDGGSTLSLNNLADMYENGDGVPKDLPRAVDMYRQAARAGEGAGFISLASLYRTGKGLPHDQVLAYTYSVIAVQLGDKEATGERDALALTISQAEADRARADAAAWRRDQPLPGTGDAPAAPCSDCQVVDRSTKPAVS